MNPRTATLLFHAFIFAVSVDFFALMVSIYCGLKTVADFRAKRIGMGIWGVVCTLACLALALSLLLSLPGLFTRSMHLR
jgi:hypothetical protein